MPTYSVSRGQVAVDLRLLRALRIDEIPGFTATICHLNLLAVELVVLRVQGIGKVPDIPRRMQDLPWSNARNSLTRLEDQQESVKSKEDLGYGMTKESMVIVAVENAVRVEIVEFIGISLKKIR
jgi:hypothetical protein